MPLTVLQKIQIAQISQFLAGNEIEKAGYEGGGEDLRLPRKLYMIRKNVQWLYNLDPSDSTLTSTSNYLYALCNRYKFAAESKINTGGSVAPISPIAVPEPYDWVIGTTTSATAPLKNGDTTVTLDGTNGTQDYRGYNIEFTRNDFTQYTTPPPDGVSTYHNWNRVTGVLTLLNGAAQLTERFRILPTR